MAKRVIDSGKDLLPTCCNNKLTQSEIIKKCLEGLLNEPKDIEAFSGFLCEKFMRQILAEKKMLRGEDFDNSEKFFSDAQLESIRKLEKLEIDAHSPSTFDLDQLVSIKLILKNIPSLQIDIYEINTYNYCKSEQRNFDEDIDLEGLVPNWSNNV